MKGLQYPAKYGKYGYEGSLFLKSDLPNWPKEVKVRIYYAGAAPFKEALANWTLQPSTYETRDEGKTWYNITPKAK